MVGGPPKAIRSLAESRSTRASSIQVNSPCRIRGVSGEIGRGAKGQRTLDLTKLSTSFSLCNLPSRSNCSRS